MEVSETKRIDIDVECADSLAAPILSLASVSDTVDLSWTDPNTEETGYIIERSLLSTSGFAEIGSVDVNITIFEDTTVDPGVTYFYRVKASGTGLALFSNILQVDVPVPFTATWNSANISAGSTAIEHIKLPLEATGTYDFVVDWGDGNRDTITVFDQAEVDHTYASDSTYTIKIFGTLNGFRFNQTGDRLKLIDVSVWGELLLGNAGDYFRDCNNLTVSATDTLNTTSITDWSNAFDDCSSLTTVPNMGTWDLSSALDLSAMFAGCTSFNESSIDDWDVSAVTNMGTMFSSCSTFNQDISSWDVGVVTTMINMFLNAVAFNQDITGWDMVNVIVIRQMFRGATVFNQAIGVWTLTDMTDMRGCFRAANAFNQSLNAWDISGVTLMTDVFRDNTAFNGNITGWAFGSVTNVNSMFDGGTAFNQNISGWDVGSVAGFLAMFKNATSFDQDISGWDTSGATTFAQMFSGATSFDQDLGAWDVTGITDMTSMFLSVTLSTSNYDNILVGFEGQAVQDNVTFSGGNSTYTGAGAGGTARAALIADHTWTITDGGAV